MIRTTMHAPKLLAAATLLAAIGLLSNGASAQVTLLAKGTLTGSSAGSYADLSGLTGTLENGVPANLLGGLGSGLAYLSGDTFLALPDRGPNAVNFNPLLDDTASYINRFHTVKMNLQPSSSTAAGLPFTIQPDLQSTTLLHSLLPLAYGSGAGLNIGSGVPAENNVYTHYFTGRSDGFDPNYGSWDFFDARLDPESIRVSPNGLTVFISDEYGPYIYEFLRATGERLRVFILPEGAYVSHLAPTGAEEIADNTSGRVANKGLEGMAISPDGKTLAVMIQNSLLEDAAYGGAAAKMLRIATIDVPSGRTTHQFAYELTTGTGVSEIVALNDHEILVDERDGHGLGNGDKAVIKQFYKVDLAKADDVSAMNGTQAAAHAAAKTLFVNLVPLLTANGIPAAQIPAKIEGLAFGPDVNYNGQTTHTLWVANDNDFIQDVAGPGSNPNQFYVLGFTDADLQGSTYQPR